MKDSPDKPIIYEINTWVWLQALSSRYGKTIDLSSVPPSEWDALAERGCNTVWLMGVWRRSPVGRRIALYTAAIVDECRRALPGMSESDVVGSPYCIKEYSVDPHLGGRTGLKSAREALKERGMQLFLDFVPNHVAPDHPWTSEHPEFFFEGSSEDLRRAPEAFRQIEGHILACGKDPYFPAWSDTLQLNAFHSSLRNAAIRTLRDIALQCDGVRCDMAMLLLTDIFRNTWQRFVQSSPEEEYWRVVIEAVKESAPEFRFLAEAYWEKEWALQQLGFDYCYDKRLYDRMEHAEASSVRDHLSADIAYQSKLLRFLENHDEPRAARVFPFPRDRAAALAIATLPGGKLYFDGQYAGGQVKLPVQLGRAPVEPENPEVKAFYQKLIDLNGLLHFEDLAWKLCIAGGWPDNQSCQNLLCWAWQNPKGRFLVAINFSHTRSQGLVRLPWTDFGPQHLKLTDLLAEQQFIRTRAELEPNGLYVELEPWGFHCLWIHQDHN
jgi:hypothetical protein